MRVGSQLLNQIERCGLSAQLAEDNKEASDDSSGFRLTKIEIARAFHANDQPTITEADAALHWLVGEPGKIASVGESLDLVDQTTGEVLVSGRPGAVLTDPCLVVAWKNADAFDDSEPEDDLGLVSMGLAASMAAGGQPFRVATLAIRGRETFPRRSPEFAPDKHPALLARIKAAVGRPRVACPGDWCGGCRQAVYCPAWLARAKTSLQVFDQETATAVISPEGVPVLDITSENSSALAVRLKMLKRAIGLAEDQLKSFVRHGGPVVIDGKQMHLGECKGRETVSAEDLKAKVDDLLSACDMVRQEKLDVLELKGPIISLRKLIHVGQPYETTRWKNVVSAVKGKRR